MESICKHKNCTGCGACANICPRSCIEMVFDGDGFLYPLINNNLCTNCQLCRKVCPQNKRGLRGEPIIHVYKAYSKDPSVLSVSTSGGIFSELAFAVLEEGGVVYGAEMREDMRVYHAVAQNKEALLRFNGSKYISSNTKDVFRDVKARLNCGQKVLFSGTPCQIDGLVHYLQKRYDNLYTVDFVCHGIGSSKVFQFFLNYLEKTHAKKVTDVKFRSKQNGYLNTSFAVQLKSEKEEAMLSFPSYGYGFGKLFADGKINRENCATCRYTSTVRVSDITLADCVVDLTNDEQERGCSFVNINTKRGIALFEAIQDRIRFQMVDVEFEKKAQRHLSKPQPMSPYRKKIFREIDKVDFADIMKKYMNTRPSRRKKIISTIKSAAIKTIRVLIKKR